MTLPLLTTRVLDWAELAYCKTLANTASQALPRVRRAYTCPKTWHISDNLSVAAALRKTAPEDRFVCRLQTYRHQCSAALPGASRSARKRDTHAPPRPPLRRLRDAGGQVQLPQMPRKLLLHRVLPDAQGDVRSPDGCDEGAAEAGRTGETGRPATGSRFRRGAIDAGATFEDSELRVGQRGVATGTFTERLAGHDRGLDRP